MNETNSTKNQKLKLEKNTNFLIISAPFYEEINRNLRDGAETILKNNGVKYKHITVPGALEIPTAISLMKDHFSGFVALGCVIRGETTHYESVCQNSANSISKLGLKGICIGNGIITVENFKQAHERSDLNDLDKGGDAARAAVGLMLLKQKYITR